MRAICCLLICVFATGLISNRAAAADTPAKDTVALVNQLRLKQINKLVNLTEDQQKKVQVLFEEEAPRLRAVQANDSLDVAQKSQQQAAIKKETGEKIKALLTDEQKVKYEASLAPRKKGAPAVPKS